jgi:short subunit dehydrogenase-like uncharacterized protein
MLAKESLDISRSARPQRFGYEARSLSSPFIHACMNSHGVVRSKSVSMFKYMSGIIASVNRSTIGYFKSVTAVIPE